MSQHGPGSMMQEGFETAHTRFEPVWVVSLQAPAAEAEAILDAVHAVAPLTMGAYDCCSFQSAAGLERYRPREGAAAGAETELRRRPDVVEVAFQLEPDAALLAAVVDAVTAVHSYQEPAILVTPALASRSLGGDAANPNRWWNKGGDWMKKP